MFYVEVVTANLTNPEDVKQRVIDHDSREARVWLGRHCFWAMRNGFAVMTRPYPTEKPAPADG